jgi:serine/threonine protein kinase
VLPIRSVEAVGDDELLLTYPPVAGEGLANVLRAGPLPLPQAIAVLRQVCRSLAAAHTVGVEHRVLGPASIVLLGTDTPDAIGIMDYGVAPLYDEDDDGSSCIELHPMTPERVFGGGTERSEDVYLVGCLGYWVFGGAPPFPAGDIATLRRRHAIEDARRLDELPVDHLPDSIVDIVARALEKDPTDRFSSVAQLDAALVEAQTAAGIETRWGSVPTPSAGQPDVWQPPVLRVESSSRLRVAHHPRLATARRRTPLMVGRVEDEPSDASENEAAESEPQSDEARAPTMEVDPASIMPQRAPAKDREGHSHPPSAPIPLRMWLRRPIVGAATAAMACLALLILWPGDDDNGSAQSSRGASLVPPFPRGTPGDTVPEPTRLGPNADNDNDRLPPVPGSMPPMPRVDASAPSLVDPQPQRALVAQRSPPSPSDAPPASAAVGVTEAQGPTRCELTRRAALDARRAHDWKGLLRHTERARCWGSSDPRAPLRIKALMELGRFSECADVGRSLTHDDAEIRRWTRLCEKRTENES